MNETKHQKKYVEAEDYRHHTSAYIIIGNLDKRIAELEGELEKHQWISVEDRLPEVPQGRDSIQVEFYDVKKNHVGIICLIKDGNNDWIKAYSVTHFRYITLPERIINDN